MNFAPMAINMLGFKVNSMDRASTVSLGPIQQVGFFLSTKRNQGFGEQNGDVNAITLPINSVIDPDVIDVSSQKNSIV